jgi:hypothetical protein
MNFDVNVVVLVGQVILASILVWIALKKAPRERQSMDATTANQYAQAAKIKGEENASLQREITALVTRLGLQAPGRKYRIIMDFTIGDQPELGKVTIEPVDIPTLGIDRNTKLDSGPKES